MAAPSPQPVGQDPVQVDPKHYKLELENDRIRVLPVNYGPREKSAMHGHSEVLAVFLTANHGKFTFLTGSRRSEKILLTSPSR